MKLNHTFRHLDISESLTQYSQNRLDDAARFLLKKGEGSIHYSKTQHQFYVEISVNTREKFFKASGENMDAYAAVDEAVSKLEKQFIKTKKSVKNHKRPEMNRWARMKRAA